MNIISNFSFSEEININDTVECIRNSTPTKKGELKNKLERATNLSQEERTSSTNSSNYIF